MATNLNLGNQLLTVDYKLPIRSQRFNEFLRDLIYPGIYKGLELSIVDIDTIQVSPGNIWFNAESGAGINVISVKVRLQSAFNLDVDPVNPVLYTRLTWSNVTDNYAEFDFAPDLNSIPTNALVVGELLFDGGNNLVGIDYSNRSRGSIDWNSDGQLTTTLSPTEDYHVGNEKWNRDKYLRYVTQPINGNRLITSISSNSTISGNTTVYESDIIITGNSVLIPYNVSINGDLTVTGTTTTINSQTLEVEDKNIEIAKVTTPTDITADGGGITLKGSTDKTIDWTQSGNQWNSSEHWNLAVGKEYRINGIKVMDSTSLGSGIVSAPGLSQIGTITGGTWQGDVIATNYGGTGQSSYTDGEILIGKTNGSLAKKTIDGTTNRVLVTNGDGTITLSTPQDIHQGASPTFSVLNILGDITTNNTDKRIFSGLGNKVLDIADSNSIVKVRGTFQVSGNSVLNSLDVIENSIELNKVTFPTNANADGGGLIVKGTTDKTFTYDDGGSKYWESSENINLVSGKSYFINGVDVMSQALAKQDNLTNPYVTISSVGAVNNLDTTTNNYVRLSASSSLTGVVAPTGSKNALLIRNTNVVNLLIENDSASSSANNRIITGTGGSIELSPDASLLLTYDVDSSKWITVGGTGGSGGGGSEFSVTEANTFVKGDPIYFNGVNWELAESSNISTIANAIVTRANSLEFTASTSGELELTGSEINDLIGDTVFVPGSIYYTSDDNATVKYKTLSPAISNPMFKAISTTRIIIQIGFQASSNGVGESIVEDTFSIVTPTDNLTLSSAPLGKSYVWVSLDGFVEEPDAFTIANNVITFTYTIPASTKVVIKYVKTFKLDTRNNIYKQIFTATASQTDFNLNVTPENSLYVTPYIDGAVQYDSFVLSGNVLTFDTPLSAGQIVYVEVIQAVNFDIDVNNYITRKVVDIANDGDVLISTVFGDNISAEYRIKLQDNPRIWCHAWLHVGTDADFFTISSDVSNTFGTASKLNIDYNTNSIRIQNRTGSSRSVVIVREL